jgi:hypothetical protein
MQNEYATRYRAEFIEPGFVYYDDVGTVLVSQEALDKMMSSFIGKPVVNYEHRDLSPEEAFKLDENQVSAIADGVVTDCGRLDNGWYYADMIIWNKQTIDNIDNKGYSVSCAYIPAKTKTGGKHNNVEYVEEVTNGTYTHMAIVNNPRYEKAKIYYNSMEDKMANKIFRFLKNQDDEKKEEKENMEEKINMNEAFVEINGEQVPIEKLLESYRSMKDNSEEEKSNVLNPEDEVDIDGEKIMVSELIASYSKSNAEPQTDEPDEPDVKENSNFKTVKNSIQKSQDEIVMSVNTRSERLARGKKLYGGK